VCLICVLAAAEQLISDLGIDKDEIGTKLIFVSQTPDYRMPVTSITHKHRLGLANIQLHLTSV
jgi:3-oxoacyl-[acyl-carrier-protein] synthase-3